MPVLGNAKHEIYCKHRARGMIPSKAALATGYAAGSSTTALETNPEIEERIKELMDEIDMKREQMRIAASETAKMVGQLTGMGRSWVITQLAENAKRAADDGDYKESNRALELIGKDFGMFDGGSSGDESTNGEVKTFDMDTLDAVLTTAENAIPREALAESKIITNDQVMEMVQGHLTKPKDVAKERQIQTGSETDVALENDFEMEDYDSSDMGDLVDDPKADVDPDAIEWESIDPQTPPEKIIERVQAAQVVRSGGRRFTKS